MEVTDIVNVQMEEEVYHVMLHDKHNKIDYLNSFLNKFQYNIY
jgi:hypothetical protein